MILIFYCLGLSILQNGISLCCIYAKDNEAYGIFQLFSNMLLGKFELLYVIYQCLMSIKI